MALRVQYFTTQIYFTKSKFQFTQSKIHFTQSKFHFTQLGIHFAQFKFSPSGPYFCYHQSLIYYKDWLLSVLFTMYRHVGKLSLKSKEQIKKQKHVIRPDMISLVVIHDQLLLITILQS